MSLAKYYIHVDHQSPCDAAVKKGKVEDYETSEETIVLGVMRSGTVMDKCRDDRMGQNCND